MHFRTGRLAGMAAAVCLVISSFLAVLVYFSVVAEPYPQFDIDLFPLGRLDFGYVQSLWNWRRNFFPWQIAIEFFLAVGLLICIHPVICLKKVYSRRASPLALNIMSNAFIIGVALNGFEFLENLGTEATGAILSRAAITTEQGASLEIAYNLGEALSIWIFSMDYVFIAIGFGMSTYLSFRYNLFNAWHGVIGAVCGVLCLASFALEIAQVAHSDVFAAFGSVTLLFTGLFFPAWLVWLAYVFGLDTFLLEQSSSAAAAQQIAAQPPTL